MIDPPPIAWAVRANDIGRVRARLDQGLDPYHEDDGCHPMSWAAEHGYLDIVKLLIERGVDPNRGGSALSSAVSAGQLEVIRYLLNIGQDPNATYDGRESAVECAKRRSQGKALALLQGEDPDQVEADDDDGEYSFVYPQPPAGIGLSEDFLTALRQRSADPDNLRFVPHGTSWCTQIDITFGQEEAEGLLEPVRDVICFLLKHEQAIYECLLQWYKGRLPKEWNFRDCPATLPYFVVQVANVADLVKVVGGHWSIYASLSPEERRPQISVGLPCRIDGEHDIALSFGKRKIVKEILVG